MELINWINRRLRADHARHLIVCALIALAAARVGPLLLGLPPWACALLGAFVASVLWEAWQRATDEGHASWNDVGAGLAGGVVVALASLP
jgi:hypothetical protein